MPSPMPRQTRAVLASLSSCAMAAFPVLKPGRRSHYMISGLAQCSFALRPARSLTPFKGAFSIEGSGLLVASSPAPIATGWSEICRVGLLPTGVLRLSHGALQQSPSVGHYGNVWGQWAFGKVNGPESGQIVLAPLGNKRKIWSPGPEIIQTFTFDGASKMTSKATVVYDRPIRPSVFGSPMAGECWACGLALNGGVWKARSNP